jgi:very-short-patch-repair endonuclease
VVDCARHLPFDEALDVADSALRSRPVTAVDLATVAKQVRGPGRPQVLRVLAHASSKAANPFESVLRAIALGVPGLDLSPQVGIAVAGSERVTPDLVDVSLGIVVEADSHEFHTGREQLVVDCWRYDELTLAGWDVYRFIFEQVMWRQGWVASVLRRAAAKARATQQPRSSSALSASRTALPGFRCRGDPQPGPAAQGPSCSTRRSAAAYGSVRPSMTSRARAVTPS